MTPLESVDGESMSLEVAVESWESPDRTIPFGTSCAWASPKDSKRTKPQNILLMILNIQKCKRRNTNIAWLIVIFRGMKKLIILFVLAVVLGLGYLFVKRQGAENPAVDDTKTVVPAERLSLWEAAGRANMVMVASVGLGREERRQVISGRRYLNLVQLLKVKGHWDEQDAFTDNCKEGARLEFYRDTVLVGEFRLTDRIGQEGGRGVWMPNQSNGDTFVKMGDRTGYWKRTNMAKVNKFLKSSGVQYQACQGSVESDENESLENPAENQRTVLTMPEFGAKRKKVKQDTVPVVREDLTRDLDSVSRSALTALSEMIMPADTAVGEPLSDQFKNWNRGEVLFYDSSVQGLDRPVLKTVTLNENQMKAFGKLLENTSLETFARWGDQRYRLDAKVVLYRDSVPEMELWVVNGQYNALIKAPLQNGVNLEPKGFWRTGDSSGLKNFFENLN